MLPDYVRPARLIPAREAHEAASTRQMVNNRGFLRHAHRILRAHHVAHLPDAHVLRNCRPVGVQDPRIRTAFVTLGPEVMFDCRDAPQSEIVGRANDVVPAGQRLLVAFTVAPDWPERGAFLFIFGGDYRIELKYYFNHCGPRE